MTLTLLQYFKGSFVLFEFSIWPISISLSLVKEAGLDLYANKHGIGFLLGPLSFDIALDFKEDVGEDRQCSKCGNTTLQSLQIEDSGPMCYHCFKKVAPL